jgi:pimeloyl-ACP methyl ester carboxylesterase
MAALQAGTDQAATHTVVSFDGAELHVEETGAPDAPLTVVLAHGWSLSTRSWRAVAEGLAARAGSSPVRILRYDQRGHGLSTRGAAWHEGVDHPRYGRGPSVDQLGRDLQAVLDQLVPVGPVVLGGHSMGGMTVMALADQRPQLFEGRIVGVLLTNTSAGGLNRLTLGFPQALAAPVRNGLIKTLRKVAASPGKADRVRSRQRTDTRFAVAQARFLLFGKRAPRAAVVECNEIIKACPSATLAGFFPALMVHEKHAALPALGRTRVEFVVGKRDKLTPPSHSRRLHSAVPGARLTVVPGTGHMTPMEKPEPVIAALGSLIDHAAAKLEVRP